MKYTLLIMIALMTVGCSQRLTDFTMLSTKNINIADMSKYEVAEGKRVTGEDWVHIIVVIPCGLPDVKQAIDNAIEANTGCVGLVDGVIYSDGFYIPYIYGQSGYRVVGTPLMKKGFDVKRAVKSE